MEKLVLSKSTFIRGLQCPKSLFLYKNNFHQRDAISTTQQVLFSRGNAIGLLAQKLFPGGHDSSFSDRFKYAESVAKTQQLIQEGATIIYEASFQFEGVYAAVDILVKENGKWIAYEVKSAAKISATYLMDAALQYHVITNCGLELYDFQLIYVNTHYARRKRIEIEKLFVRKSVVTDLLSRQNLISEKIEELKKILSDGELPDIKISEHCHSPYTCDFVGTCRGEVDEDSIFYLNGISKQQHYDLYHSGIKRIMDLPLDFNFTREQKIQYECSVSGEKYLQKEEIEKFLHSITYPVSFLDFEMFMPVVPLFEDSSPYEHIPFLYSLHCKKDSSTDANHFYFLAQTGEHPIKNFISQLLLDLGKVGDILIFDPTHEKRMLQKAILLFPEWKNELIEIIARIKDLSEPFQKKLYYTKQMKGSYSMKLLLPAIAPDLNFENLKIKNGVSASTAFENLQVETDLFKVQEIRDALIEYCKMDTLGLVKIFEALGAVSPTN